jgi:hypothetical protein
MTKISSDPSDEIYIVAHSEGTVVSFLALLKAMSGTASGSSAWLKQVKGFMTIGSPIDKHLLLWPELWGRLRPAPGASAAAKIPWMNYYDYGDPIGYWVKSSQAWLNRHGFDGFDISDFGYSRYYLPGKAHVDYWQDNYIFGHFISKVVDPHPGPQAPGTAAPAASANKPTGTAVSAGSANKVSAGKVSVETSLPAASPPEAGGHPAQTSEPPDPEALENAARAARALKYAEDPCNFFWARILSYWASYAVVFLLQLSGVFILYKTVDGIVGPSDLSPAAFLGNTAGLAALLTGMTVSARVVCLSRQLRYYLIGVGAFIPAAALYCRLPREDFRAALGAFLPTAPTAFVVGLALGLVLLGAFVGRKWPRWGIRIFILGAGIVVSVVVALILIRDGGGGAVWPVLPATAAFLYLWWLAAIFFDLIFVWHLYVRHSKFLSSLQDFKDNKIKAAALKA